MRTNTRTAKKAAKTHEGAPAASLTIEQQLRRSVMACMLWEREFYEEGEAIADRVQKLARQVPPTTLATMAVEARHQMHLRHAPLMLLAVLAETGKGTRLVSECIATTIGRADEMGEFLAIYAKMNGVEPNDPKGGLRKKLSNQVRKGLAKAFTKFDAYQLGKYDREAPVRLRDVMFMAHPKPNNQAQQAIWKQLVDKTLEAPDTWEVALSGGADKKETFTRLIQENKLGYLALLRNLRNMRDAGVDHEVIKDAILARRGADRVLPFRYIAAARHVPEFAMELDQALMNTAKGMSPLKGKTIVLVDVSGSMDAKLSGKSDLTRMDAAATLASIIPGECEVYSFSTHVRHVPGAREGMAGIEAIINSQGHGSTYIGNAVEHVNALEHDRLIVITDEQSHDQVEGPRAKGYMINVASAQNGVGYGPWVRISGFSENVLRYIAAHEGE